MILFAISPIRQTASLRSRLGTRSNRSCLFMLLVATSAGPVAGATGDTTSDSPVRPRVQVTLIDSTRIEGRFEGVGDGKVLLATPQGLAQHPIDDLSELRFLHQPAAVGNSRQVTVVFHLADGGRLTGTLLPAGTGSEDDSPPVEDGGETATDDGSPKQTSLSGFATNIRATIDGLGDLVLPLTALAGVRFADKSAHADADARLADGLANRPVETDVLISVRDGQVVTAGGTLMSLGIDGGVFRFSGRDRTFRLDAVYAILLAKGTATPASSSASAGITLVNGSSFGGTLGDSTGDVLIVDASFGSRLTIPTQQIAHVRFTSPRIVYLSELDPVAIHSEGITQSPWPVRMDRNASNGPIMLDGRVHEKGIGMHARAWIDFDINSEFVDLLATIGIDDAVRPNGEVVFRVIGDDRTLFDSGTVTGWDAPRSIRVDVRGIQRLRLMADYGAELDLGSHADWADARLIRPSNGSSVTSKTTDDLL